MALPSTVKSIQREAQTPPARVLMLEQHFSVSEIAEKWSVSHNFVLEKFQDEPGIVRSPGKRGLIRIPASTLERVYKGMLEAAAGR
jgi:hypothetical protein